jgi:hypothetical protein
VRVPVVISANRRTTQRSDWNAGRPRVRAADPAAIQPLFECIDVLEGEHKTAPHAHMAHRYALPAGEAS